MAWWAWLVLGAGLLGAETVVTTDFWIATVGAAAMVMGLALTLFAGPRAWIQWIVFAALAVAFNVLFRRRVHERWVGRPPGLEPDAVGASRAAVAPITPGAAGAV